ncbi:MAG: hypothetical protein HW381_1031, partial [Candidatus Rokubacteria bacterium]|nr:hypothetical protein [Candidatus Rokubacteria bacterium]
SIDLCDWARLGTVFGVSPSLMVVTMLTVLRVRALAGR